MRFFLLVVFSFIALSCSTKKTQDADPYERYTNQFVSEYFMGTKEIQCLVDFESPLVGFQDDFAFMKIKNQTDQVQGCNIQFSRESKDEMLNSAQATLHFGCWVASFSGFANLFDYAAMDRLQIKSDSDHLFFNDGQISVKAKKSLDHSEILFKKDGIRLEIDYAREAGHRLRWKKAVMHAKIKDVEKDLVSEVLPIYGQDASWPEKISIVSLGVKSDITLRNCKRIR